METQDTESKLIDTDLPNDIKKFLKEYIQRYDGSMGYLYKCISCMASFTPTQLLLRCSGCQLVFYCDRVCQRDDWKNHKYICREFPIVNGRNAFYTKVSWGKHLENLRERAVRVAKDPYSVDDIFKIPRVCHNCWDTQSEDITLCKCTCVSYCSEKCADTDILHKDKCEHFREVLRQSYTISIFNALHEASTRLCQGGDACSFYDRATLTIHVIDSSPIIDSRAWEDFIGKFPKLKNLIIVFVVQSKWPPWFIPNCPLNVANTANITYSVQQMEYHMFFSLTEYTEPDVVVIFGNADEMELDNDTYEATFHSEISYGNIVFSFTTILVLMDKSEELVSNGAKTINAIQSVIQLVPLQVNPIKKLISNTEPDIDSGCEFLNHMQYYICLMKK